MQDAGIPAARELCWRLGAIEERHIWAVKNDYLLGAGFS
jgi:hypothetical protein